MIEAQGDHVRAVVEIGDLEPHRLAVGDAGYRGQERVDRAVGIGQDRLERRRDAHVADQHAEVLQPQPVGQPHRHGVGRRRRLEPDGEEHDLTVGVPFGDGDGIERRVHDAHVASRGPYREQIARGPGHAKHVAEGAEGDTIVTADGEVLPVGSGVDRLRQSDEARLVELYEAQALAANPFLAKGSYEQAANDGVGAAMVAALLLDNLSGMAAVSFAQKAVQSGMLSEEEGRAVLAIVQLAAPGEAESALNDHLSHRKLLTFSAIVESWRSQTSKSEE